MSTQSPDIFLIRADGTEQKLEGTQIRLDYKNGAKVSLRIGLEKDPEELEIQGFYGEQGAQATPEQIVIFNLRPGASNLIILKPTLHTPKSLGCEPEYKKP